MKNKKLIIAIVAVLIVLSVGAFYFISKGKDNTTSKSRTEGTSSSQSSEAKTQETAKVTLSGALSQIGATGSSGPVNGNTYTFNEVEYKFEEPTNWSTSLNQRKQACDAGYVGTSYQVVTDESTWFASTDNNEDYAALVDALKGAGINATTASYC